MNLEQKNETDHSKKQMLIKNHCTKRSSEGEKRESFK